MKLNESKALRMYAGHPNVDFVHKRVKVERWTACVDENPVGPTFYLGESGQPLSIVKTEEDLQAIEALVAWLRKEMKSHET